MKLKFIDEADLKGKKVLIRVDFNVPLTKEPPFKITDPSRIELALPTIKYALEQGASKITLMSHLGRPKNGFEEKFSLEPIATYLAEKLQTDVILSESAIDNGVKSFLNLPETKVVLLQNLRFHAEETKNDRDFAEQLASYGDIYINDAFGAAHRKHASVYEINRFFNGKAFAGLLMKKELESLNTLLNQPKKPFVAVIGGAKVSDKIQTIQKLLTVVDKVLIGGAMAYPFLKAKGQEVGKSLCSVEDVELAKTLIKNEKIILPMDHQVATSFEDNEPKLVDFISESDIGFDIGERTIKTYQDVITHAKTIFWNGPMGLFENGLYNKGTFAMAKAIASSNAYSVVGGGDSVAAANRSGFSDSFSHISTGGGASLEYIEKGELPGVVALRMGVS